MALPEHSPRKVRFGVFEVDLSAGELRKQGVRLRLQEQPFQILAALLERPGEVITREELISRLWPNGVVVDFDRGLNAAVTRLRQALSDSAEAPRYVETVARRGYRFLAPVLSPEPTTSSSEPSPPQIPKKRGWWLPAAAFCALAAAGLAWWTLRPQAPRSADIRFDATPLTTEPGTERCPSFSPDGSHVAFEWMQGTGETHIFTKVVGPGDPVRLTSSSAMEFSPVWSRDGRNIAFLRIIEEGKIGVFVIPALGGVERKVAETIPQLWVLRNQLRWIDWFPDNRHLIVSGSQNAGASSGLFLVNVETDDQRRLTHLPGTDPFGDREPAVSPDGRTVAFTRGPLSGDPIVHLLPLSADLQPSGEPRKLVNERSLNPAWMPDGREIVFVSPRGLSTISLTPGAAPREWFSLGLQIANPTVSKSGQLAFSRASIDSNIWRQEIPTSPGTPPPPVRLIASTARDQDAQYSPDGNLIAFQSTRSEFSEIHVCDSNGAHCFQLTHFRRPYITGAPRWSPDGKWIAFDSAAERQGDFVVYVVSATGGSPRRLTQLTAFSAIPRWSRDGQSIYFCSTRTGRAEIWRVPSAGGQEVQITHNGGLAASESPDGAYLYYTKSDEDKTFWRCALDGSGETRVLTGVTNRGWAFFPGGMYYLRLEAAGALTIRRHIFSTGQDTFLAPLAKPTYLGLSLAPDGKQLIYTQFDEQGADLMVVPDFASVIARQ